MSDDTLSAAAFSVSDPLTVTDLERLYHQVILKQNFYGETYGAEWNLQPYQDMAKLIAAVLAPRKHVDVGCGKAFLVLAMRQLGITSFGIDFSEALVKQAPAEVKPFVVAAKIEDWITNRVFQEADLITYMEVFEHLPLSMCQFILQTLRTHYPGRLLITTPSYGIDERIKLGICTNDRTPFWRQDMAENLPFRNIVLKDGLPHHGHITLCSYRYWTEFFLFHGWVRSHDLESNAIEGFKSTLVKYNWNPYILEKLVSNRFDIDVTTSSAHLGFGWHAADCLNGTPLGRWTDGRGEIYVNCDNLKVKMISVELSAPIANIIKEFSLTVVGEQLVQTSTHQLQWRPLFTSLPVSIVPRCIRIRLDLALLRRTEECESNVQASPTFRITLISPSYSPFAYGLSDDRRSLGLFVHKIKIIQEVGE